MAYELTAGEIQQLLQENGLGIDKSLDIIAHVSLDSLGIVEGGAEAVVDAILAAARTVVMPAFTYQTQVIPQSGPPNNALVYGSGDALNAKAEIFRPDLAVHPDCGSVAEALRQKTGTLRSIHPVLSFVAHGPSARVALASQTFENPLGPMAWLEAHDGAVLLMGLDQRHNFSLHLAEQRAGRQDFVRWALTMDGIEELPHMPGCMQGFNAIWPELANITRVQQIGLARCELIPLEPLLAYAEERLRQHPNSLLCDKPGCLSCRAREV